MIKFSIYKLNNYKGGIDLHEGHRSRLKKKFLLNDMDYFEDHEALELILFYAIPRKNTNDVAHNLLKKFGSVDQILDAPIKILQEVEGVGESAAILIKSISSIIRIYLERKYSGSENYLSLKDLSDKLMLKFTSRLEEVVAIALVDAKGKLIYDGIVNKGSVSAVEIYARKIIELIVLYNASGVMLAHNHPSGFALPSSDDIETTKKLSDILKSMKVELLDHIIVADGDYISLRESGMHELF